MLIYRCTLCWAFFVAQDLPPENKKHHQLIHSGCDSTHSIHGKHIPELPALKIA
jgi:hypothetical protein